MVPSRPLRLLASESHGSNRFASLLPPLLPSRERGSERFWPRLRLWVFVTHLGGDLSLEEMMFAVASGTSARCRRARRRGRRVGAIRSAEVRGVREGTPGSLGGGGSWRSGRSGSTASLKWSHLRLGAGPRRLELASRCPGWGLPPRHGDAPSEGSGEPNRAR